MVRGVCLCLSYFSRVGYAALLLSFGCKTHLIKLVYVVLYFVAKGN